MFFSAGVFASGFLAGYAALWILSRFTVYSAYFVTFPRVILYILNVVGELCLSGLRVAKVILSPRLDITPGIVAVPLRLKSDAAILILANSITLTPGTLSLQVSDDKKTLYVHGMFLKDPEAFRREITAGFERKIMEFCP